MKYEVFAVGFQSFHFLQTDKTSYIYVLCDSLKTVLKLKVPKILRVIFLKETVLLIFGLVWLWFSIGLFLDGNYTIKDLKPHNGVVERLDSVIIKVKDKPLFKEVTKQLRLQLSSDNNVYTLETTENFVNVVSKVNIGDSVTVFTKPKLWGIFGLKKASVINHLTKDKGVVIDYTTYKSSISGLFYLTLIFSIVLLVVYVVKLRNRIWWDFDGYKSAKSIS